MNERTGEPSHRARGAEAHEHFSVNVATEQPETLKGAHEVRDRYRCHRDLGARLHGEHRRQQAPDTKAGYCSDRRRRKADHTEERREEHERILTTVIPGSHGRRRRLHVPVISRLGRSPIDKTEVIHHPFRASEGA